MVQMPWSILTIFGVQAFGVVTNYIQAVSSIDLVKTMAKAVISPFTLQGEPAGFGTLPMGCLDRDGYSMSNEKDFYTKFIIELVPNNVNDATFLVNQLKPLKPKQPRFYTRTFNSGTQWAINAPDRMNVMYNNHVYARGELSGMESVIVKNESFTYEEARAWAYEKQVRPRLIHFSLPSSPEKCLWIDMSWPIRNILLPISQASGPGEQPNCTYVQINFRELRGLISTDGWMEDGNQRAWVDWEGDNKRGLVWDKSAATMRVDLELLYKLLTLPRHMRKDDYNPLIALQLLRWDIGVPYNPSLKPVPSTGSLVTETGRYISNYTLPNGKGERWSTAGMAMDDFLSFVNGVKVNYVEPQQSTMVKILNAIVSTGLSFVPVIGPLLAIGSDLAFQALRDPTAPGIRDKLTAEYGADLALAILESAVGYHDYTKASTRMEDAPHPGTMPQKLYFGESPDDYKLNPNIMELTEAEKESLEKYGPKKLDEDTAAPSDEAE
ncbi:hypothetical protein M758_2G074000 [Ceratodon purpureus]|nr:hypothetical protein M758_2G074000 [Ceratodon purpureus]